MKLCRNVADRWRPRQIEPLALFGSDPVKGPGGPFVHLLDHLLRDPGDRLLRHGRAIDLGEVRTDLPHGTGDGSLPCAPVRELLQPWLRLGRDSLQLARLNSGVQVSFLWGDSVGKTEKQRVSTASGSLYLLGLTPVFPVFQPLS